MNNDSAVSLKTHARISQICGQLNKFLICKNLRYGNSAMEPQRIFSKASNEEQLLVRMDDKISRISNAHELRKNDVVDLMGYLVLYCVSRGWDDFEDMVD